MDQLYRVRLCTFTDELDAKKHALIKSEVWLAAMEIMDDLGIRTKSTRGKNDAKREAAPRQKLRRRSSRESRVFEFEANAKAEDGGKVEPTPRVPMSPNVFGLMSPPYVDALRLDVEDEHASQSTMLRSIAEVAQEDMSFSQASPRPRRRTVKTPKDHKVCLPPSDNDDDDDSSEAPHGARGVVTKEAQVLAGRAKYIPMRLSDAERVLFNLLDASLNVSEYTDKVDILSYPSPVERILTKLTCLFNVMSGMMVYPLPRYLACRLNSRNGLDLLLDADVPIATRSISDTSAQAAVQRQEKAAAIASLLCDQGLDGRRHSACLASIDDNNSYIALNCGPISKIQAYLERYFLSPSGGFALDIRAGRNGARLTHKHKTQFAYAMQSLSLWKNITLEIRSSRCC
ncbi:hypothetical protein SDRG_06877 [Saprolegnia diclina VS20]|uniref:Non-canonical E2 ubiquitin-conjugating enzyme C-terminal domain-containing protein n=1 Tax=Saprolegnia diclina (strain VS20) TaxID=1156394 RepID=T0QCH8_SAPDV|nr:hypothetical protein SDRG_06877 [Saprolegnia diclina VS20]EQC35589.1 hypothetical protein SDRG_06877 [Saprolegnia diclina VS20]|eukprot:XP_008610906.1 hypothetical protein SDRG_06877 [Saprolegnia diclina VS20]